MPIVGGLDIHRKQTALTSSNDGQIPDGHDVAGHQDADGLATGARRPRRTWRATSWQEARHRR